MNKLVVGAAHCWMTANCRLSTVTVPIRNPPSLLRLLLTTRYRPRLLQAEEDNVHDCPCPALLHKF